MKTCNLIFVLWTIVLKGTKTLLSSYIYCKAWFICIKHWRFEWNQARNREVTAFSNLHNMSPSIHSCLPYLDFRKEIVIVTGKVGKQWISVVHNKPLAKEVFGCLLDTLISIFLVYIECNGIKNNWKPISPRMCIFEQPILKSWLIPLVFLLWSSGDC